MPCSICGNHGHNIRTCDGVEFLKDIKICDEYYTKEDMEKQTEFSLCDQLSSLKIKDANNESAITIQKNIRGYLIRRDLLKNESAITVQKNIRGYLSRKHVFTIVKNFTNLLDINKLSDMVKNEFENTVRGKLAKERNSKLKIDSDISEFWIQKCINNGEHVGNGSSPIDVLNKQIAIDVGCLCLNNNNTNEKSIIQNFKTSGNSLDTYFEENKDEHALELFINDIKKKFKYTEKEKYYFIFISTNTEVYLSVLKINVNKLEFVTSNGFTPKKKSIKTNGFIHNKYGSVTLYKSKKRLELRLSKNILKHSKKLFTLI